MNHFMKNYQNKNVVERFSKEQNVPIEKSNELFENLKSFLADSVENSRESHPTKEIDKIWHTFILHTQDYSEFCNTYLGTFVHHTPCDSINGSDCSTTQVG